MKFSLFFFSEDADGQRGTNPYKLLLESAKTADDSYIEAVWTPERHFTRFGGTYPNPAITSAALSSITNKIRIRSGSVILPLHDPIRVAEDWSVIDNLSEGRVDLSFGSGWNINDFCLAPENYDDRREIMFRGIDVVRRLWRGENIEFPNGGGNGFPVRTLPRPVQKELTVWLTAQSQGTFEVAGGQDLNVLTNLNFCPRRKLQKNIDSYSEAKRRSGQKDGRVTLMMHTYISSDTEQARQECDPALRGYLRSNLNMRADFHKGKEGDPVQELDAQDIDAIISNGVETIFHWSGLIGDLEHCRRRVEDLAEQGVGEIACLIDFGLGFEESMTNVRRIKELAELCAKF